MFIINTAKVSNIDIVCAGNPSEVKAKASDCSKQAMDRRSLPRST